MITTWNLRVFPRKFIFTFRGVSTSFKVSDLRVSETKNRKLLPTKIVGFGKCFTDHMLAIPWNAQEGWDIPHICEYGPITVSPAIRALHYATSAFEGIKVVKGVDGHPRLFRADKHLNRFLDSTRRLALPEFSKDELLACIKKLINLDRRWIPDGEGESLYIRPVIFGSDACLGVDISTEATLCVLLSPAASYFARDEAGVSVYADPKFVRAWEGGSGAFKLSANYAPTLHVHQTVHKKGCHTSLWLYGPDEYITEAGTMNIFLLWVNEEGEKELLTPPLNGLILPGVTRDSVLQIARGLNGFTVSEKNVTMSQLITALKEGRVINMFGSGTACVISPITEMLYRDIRFKLPAMNQPDCIPARIKKIYTDIQTGVTSPHPWTTLVD